MKEELNRKLAEFAGLKDAHIDDLGHAIYRKDCIRTGADWEWVRVPNFTESLDACEKWLLPKLMDKWDLIDLIWDAGAWDIYLENYTTGENFYLGLLAGETFEKLPMAICRTIEKLLDKENDE